MNWKSRLEKLRPKLAEKEIDAIFISQPENRLYLSGFGGSAGYLLITPKDAILATDFRYLEQAKAQAPEYEVFQISGSMANWFPDLVGELNLRKLGFEAGDIAFDLYQRLSEIVKKAQPKLGLVPVDGVVESLRAVKEPEEIELITRAVEIADRAFEDVAARIQAGMTEKEIAWELEKSMREQGSGAVPFEIIVASGPNAALPHAKPSERKISAEDAIVIDMGAKVGGYCSDLSRTIRLHISPVKEDRFNSIYDTVLGAQLMAIAMIKEGMVGKEVDDLARTFFRQRDLAEAFGHSLGHGVGLAEHEQPTVGPNSGEILTEGMVFTVEPGLYFPGWGGVRIEDVVVIENGKAKVISRAKK